MWIIKAARQGFIIEQMIQERSRTAHGSREKAKKKNSFASFHITYY
jgi:hypothetical protein